MWKNWDQVYTRKKKAFKHLCRKKKRQHYNRVIKCIDLSNAKTAWRQLRKLFNLGKSKNMQKKPTSDDLGKFYSYFKKLKTAKWRVHTNKIRGHGPPRLWNIWTETVTDIDLLKTEKAPGVDNILCELLKHGKEALKGPLTGTLPCGVMA